MRPLPLLAACLLSITVAAHTLVDNGGRAEDEELTEEQALKVFCDDPHRAICSAKGAQEAREKAAWDFERLSREVAGVVRARVLKRFCDQGIELSDDELYAVPDNFVRHDGKRKEIAALQKGDDEPRGGGDDDEKPKCTGPRKKKDLKPAEPYGEYLKELYKEVLSLIKLPPETLDKLREGVANGLAASKKFPKDVLKRFDKKRPAIRISGDAVLQLSDPKYEAPDTKKKGDSRFLIGFQQSCREDAMNFNGFYMKAYHAITLCPGFLLWLARIPDDPDARPPFPVRQGQLCNTIAHEAAHGADWGAAPGAYDRFFSCLATYFNKPDGNVQKDPKRLAKDYGHEITADYWGARSLAACYAKETDRKKLMAVFRDAFETFCDVQADNLEDQGAHNHPDGSYRILLAVQPFREKMGCPLSKEKPRCGLDGEEVL